MLKVFFSVLAGNTVRIISQILNLGSGATWSGEVALWVEPKVLEKISKMCRQVILVTGTNGKTTTVKMLETIMGKTSFSNRTGANLLNGIAASFIANFFTLFLRRKTTAILEIDEAAFPLILKKIEPKAVVILNLFRDQLDRYGEVNMVAAKWRKALSALGLSVSLILNADDPEVASLGTNSKAKVYYFGLEEGGEFAQRKQAENWGDSIFCPKCGAKLIFKKVFFSHLGHWLCNNCQFKRAKTEANEKKYNIKTFNLYNKYNLLAAIQTGLIFLKNEKEVLSRISVMEPAFGRWESFESHNFGSKGITLVLSKNPTGTTENLRLVWEQKDLGSLLFILNDRIPDGLDVSWIWDIHFEKKARQIPFVVISGTRYLDMALRLKYEEIFEKKASLEKNLKKAILKTLNKTEKNRQVYILATYSGMLEARKLITGKKIL